MFCAAIEFSEYHAQSHETVKEIAHTVVDTGQYSLILQPTSAGMFIEVNILLGSV